jgi:L-2-hydroxyglutarate oxidase
MPETRHDIVIVGAGIVGLATAVALTRQRPDLQLVILEKEAQIAAHQTGHNSGVIHAGLYYKPGSLKARMAVEGARRMIEFCQEHDLRYELCGKVIVAVDEAELPRLEELYRRATANGVPGIVRLTADQIKEYEPHATGVAGLWSPNTGIVDYIMVANKYAELVQAGGGDLRLNTEGLNKVNPAATILSGVLMLRHLGEKQAAQRVEDAVRAVIAAGEAVTYDLKRTRDDPTAVGTQEMADAIIEVIHSS